MNNTIKKFLKSKNIEIQSGLSEKEIEILESFYKISFPNPLKEFYMDVLPIGNGFYNWRDFNANNINSIKQMIELPKKNFSKDIGWYDEINPSICDMKEKENNALYMLESAPPLIPICAHRYMPSCKLKEYPIVSVHGIDVIYYGRDLYEYIEIELGYKRYNAIDFSSIEHIPFWTDVM